MLLTTQINCTVSPLILLTLRNPIRYDKPLFAIKSCNMMCRYAAFVDLYKIIRYAQLES